MQGSRAYNIFASMRNKDTWKPSKFIVAGRKDKWKPNPAYVHPSSYFYCSLIIDEYKRIIEQYTHGDLWDCGCGEVPFFKFYESKVQSITCTDWEGSLHKDLHLDKVVDINREVDFKSEKFDSILLADVIEHLPDPSQSLKELVRTLKPGGNLIIMTPFLYRIHEEPFDFVRLSAFYFQKEFEKLELEMLELNEIGGIFNAGLLSFNQIFARNVWMRRLCMFWSRLFLSIGFIHKTNQKTKSKYPLCYCLVGRKKRS